MSLHARKAQIGSMTMFIAFILLLVIADGGIVAGTFIFVGKGYDTRSQEAELLLRSVEQCIVQKNIDWNNFYDTCKLDKSVLEQDFLLQVKEAGREVFSINKGKVEGCRLIGAKTNPSYPVCITRNIVHENKIYEITAGSNQHARKSNA